MPSVTGEGEEKLFEVETEDRLLATMLCARDMSNEAECGAPDSVDAPMHHVDGMPDMPRQSMPIVLITDNMHIRKRVVAGLYTGLVSACCSAWAHGFVCVCARQRDYLEDVKQVTDCPDYGQQVSGL